jgi:hypothetical protein
MDAEFFVALDNDMTRIAAAAVMIGALLLRMAGWVVAGWILVVFGFLALWLAHHLAIAPIYHDPEICSQCQARCELSTLDRQKS